MGAIVPRAVDALEPDELLERLDIDALLARIDLEVLLERLDLDVVLARVDLDALMERIDVDALVARVDVNRLMADVDIDELLVRVDVNALVEDVDIAPLVARAGIDQIVSDATSGIATRALDMARRQLLGIDLVVLALVDRVLRRRRAEPSAPTEPRLWPAGPLSRALGFLIDSLTVSGLFGLGVSLISYLLTLFTGRTLGPSGGGTGALWLAGFLSWWFLYLWLSIATSGRTVGKGLVGLRVVAVDGTALHPAAAARRAVAFPFSLVLGLGFVPAVLGADRRAAHDYVAGSREIVDWGPRPVTPPERLAAWEAARRGTTLEAKEPQIPG